MSDPRKNTRDVFPPTGTKLNAKSWLTEAPLRMLMNNLHPDVAENPHELVVYPGVMHAFFGFSSMIDEARRMIDDLARFLDEHTGGR